jgi:hypothetical protein
MRLLALLLSTGLLASGAIVLPDPSKGVISGHVALMFWPGLRTQTAVQPLPLGNCTVHLILIDDQARENVYPCGVWFQPPAPSRYLHWLEQGDFISYQNVLGYAVAPFKGKGLIGLDPLFPASEVKLDPRVKLRHDETFRFVSLKIDGDQRMFDRRIPAGQIPSRTFAVPSGPVIGGVFGANGRGLKLSRPVFAKGGQITVISPEKPGKGGDVLVVIDRNVPIKETPPECHIQFLVRDKDLRPAVSAVTRDRLLYIWYEVDPGGVSLSLRCGDKSVARSITVTAKEIVTLRDELP